MSGDGDAQLAALRAGGKRAMAAALSAIEVDLDAPETTALLDAAAMVEGGMVLGLTGPPGVGKSSLIDGLIRCQRARGGTVGVIAVDPSSRVSHGALLGDRTRLVTDPADAGIFVRSMAARDRLGGLAEITYPSVVLMRAVFDLVIVETVGVGQSETAIGDVADRVAVCVQPGAGDALQFMKAGIMEIPDIVIVTKADMGAVADRTLADMTGALSLVAGGAGKGKGPPVLLACSAARGAGLDPILDAALSGIEDRAARRTGQANQWVVDTIRVRFGSEGLARLPFDDPKQDTDTPFERLNRLTKRYRSLLTCAFG